MPRSGFVSCALPAWTMELGILVRTVIDDRGFWSDGDRQIFAEKFLVNSEINDVIGRSHVVLVRQVCNNADADLHFGLFRGYSSRRAMITYLAIFVNIKTPTYGAEHGLVHAM